MAQSKNNVDIKIEKFDGHSEEWTYWYERLKVILRNNGIKNEDKKRDLLLGSLGPQPFKLVFDHSRPTPISNLSFEDVVSILHKYYCKPPAPLSQRVMFTRRFRQEGETVNSFEMALRSLANGCEFKNNLDERLRDQFIFGINNDAWQLELLRLHATTDTTLASVIDSAALLENINNQQFCLRNQDHINRVKISHEPQHQKSHDNKNESKSHFRLDKRKHCLRCGYEKHDTDQKCPAMGAECRSCGGLNHFSRVCFKSGKAVLNKGKRINSLKRTSSRSSTTSYSDVDQVRTLKHGSKVMISARLNGHSVSMLYDPGAAFSIVGEELWKSIGSPKLVPSENLIAYTGVPIQTLGKTSVNVDAFGSSRKLPLIVVKKDDIPLFGLDWVLAFDLQLPPGAKLCTVSPQTSSDSNTKARLVEEITKDFPSVFNSSLGTITNCKAVFHMSPDAVPVVAKPRPVPFALKKSVEDELQRLIDSGVLQPVNVNEEAITWASPIVIVVKPSGAIRICADFKNTINKYMLPDKYPLPRFEEIASKLTGGSEFSVIDLKDAYLQMEVDPSSQPYLVISTHKGFLKYTRLPFGVKTATGIFQRKMDQLLSGVEGVACLLDDVIITAPTREQHLERVKEVLKRFEETGVRVQSSKCKWFQTLVTYLGHRIDSAGIHPTHEHLEAIQKMPSPKNVRELRSFLGSINYYSKFVPHLQTICVPLHKLLQKGARWCWTNEHERVANKLRHLLSTSDSLAHYDEQLPLILATDASDVGLGAALYHRYPDGTERPVAFASRRLDSAESKYSIVEKEGLALIFGVTRFEQYLYGRHFEARTDHKPLIKLFGEHDQIPKVVSNRIARWALILSSYDYSISYQKGSDNKTADFLSRFPLDSDFRSPEERLGNSNEAHLFHLRAQDLPVTTKSLCNSTKHDPVLSKVITYTKTEWPCLNDLSKDLIPYYIKREEMSFENNVLLWQGRIIVPSILRPQVINILHEGHPGVSAMKSKARFQVWWPNVDKDIEAHVKFCSNCQETRSKDAEVPLFSWTVPSETWSRIHIDFAGPFQGKMWLVVVDARSKWLEVIPINNTTTKTTINALEELFSRFGYPRIIVSDNGSQLTSFEFKSYCDKLNIKHARITPYHPKSNGLAERCVRTFKDRMRASKNDKKSLNETLNAFLFSYRTTQRRSTGKTPAQIMFGRELRSKIDLLRPSVEDNFDKELVTQRKNKTQGNEKRFSEDDIVWVLNASGKGYKKGKVLKENGLYSYVIEVDGNQRRCHADQLRHA